MQDLNVSSANQMCITVADLSAAEIAIIKIVQSRAFKDEIKHLCALSNSDLMPSDRFLKKSSSLYKLDPFLDEHGVLRVGGRLKRASFSSEFKHPVILPRKHHVTDLVIGYYHQQVEHQGRGMNTGEIRENGF